MAAVRFRVFCWAAGTHMFQPRNDSDQSFEHEYIPPAPKPQVKPLGPIALIRTLRRNPLECWAAQHFERPVVTGGLPFGQVLLVHEPRAIRRVLLENVSNYQKDRLQRRVLSAGLSDGLLAAEGEPWRIQRHVLAPMFARKTVMGFSSAMTAAADALIDRCPDNVPDDLLTHLLRALGPATGDRITEPELRSNILTFIAAGHETTSNSLAWALFLLSQSSEWRHRVEAEVDRELNGNPDGCADRLIETRAVVEEAIRLYPPIAAISRVALGSDELAGERVKAGSLIVISPYVLHRHRMLWHRPTVFDPQRFLGMERSKIDRFAYLPFGVGPRICIGSAFALQEATLVLATIVRHFRFDLRPGHAVWPTLKVTLRPENGLPMILRKRPANPLHTA
jgi:cytochrome P450